MSIHFETRQEAIADLESNGWRECRTGRWVSRDGSCVAHILTTTTAVVLVQYWTL